MKNFLKALGNFFFEHKSFIDGFVLGVMLMTFIGLFQSFHHMKENINKLDSSVQKLEQLNTK